MHREPDPPTIEGATGQDWNSEEIEATIDAYVEMLEMQVTGQSFTKAQVVRTLSSRLPARTPRAIEAKFQNISAVLDELDVGWIDGYKPFPHYQEALRTAVQSRLEGGLGVREAIAAYESSQLVAATPIVRATDDVLVPVPGGANRGNARSAVLITGSRSMALRDFRARRLGRAGERWVLGLEREMLRRAGRQDLADDIRWVAREDGDGAGYDIDSYRPDGRPRRIEVKTTNLGVRTPFYITRWELEVSRRIPNEYSLYRVHGFARDPRIYVIDGAVEQRVQLQPYVFVASLA